MTPPWRIDLPLLALILANLVPVFGVLYMHWDVGAIVVLYWTENLVVGLFTLLKMLLAGGSSALGYMLFFSVHYGLFCTIHGVFVLELTQFAGDLSAPSATGSWPGPLALLQELGILAERILQAAPETFLWACFALLLSHGASFLLLFVGQGEYRRTSVDALMSAPYPRIAILHVAVLIGGFLVVELGSPLGLLLALVALKTGMDIMLHRRSHRALADSDAVDGANRHSTT